MERIKEIFLYLFFYQIQAGVSYQLFKQFRDYAFLCFLYLCENLRTRTQI
jgi:hypothetical protein